MKEKVPFFRFSAIAGLVIGFINILLTFIQNSVLGYSTSWYTLLTYAIICALYFLAIKKYRDTYFTEDFSFGKSVKVGLVIGVVEALVCWIYTSFLMPVEMTELIDQVFAQNSEQFHQQGLSAADIDMAKSVANFFISPVSLLIFGIIGGIIKGFIISALSMIFLGRKK